MYGKGHLKNSDNWRQVGRKASTPMFAEPYEVRLKRWEDKQMQQQAAAATTQAAAK